MRDVKQPTAPAINRGRRPTLSMKKTAGRVKTAEDVDDQGVHCVDSQRTGLTIHDPVATRRKQGRSVGI